MTIDGRSLCIGIDDEVVALGLACDGALDGGDQRDVALAGPYRGPQVGRIVLAQAHIELAGAGQTDPVAAFAEIVAHRP